MGRAVIGLRQYAVSFDRLDLFSNAGHGDDEEGDRGKRGEKIGGINRGEHNQED